MIGGQGLGFQVEGLRVKGYKPSSSMLPYPALATWRPMGLRNYVKLDL